MNITYYQFIFSAYLSKWLIPIHKVLYFSVLIKKMPLRSLSFGKRNKLSGIINRELNLILTLSEALSALTHSQNLLTKTQNCTFSIMA